MVRLEHVNLVMADIQPTLTFLLTAFPHWRIRGEGDMEWGSGNHSSSRHWLHVGDDDYYLTLNNNAVGEIRDLKGIQPGVAHIGFVVDDLPTVIARLSAKGFDVDITGRDIPFVARCITTTPLVFSSNFCNITAINRQRKICTVVSAVN